MGGGNHSRVSMVTRGRDERGPGPWSVVLCRGSESRVVLTNLIGQNTDRFNGPDRNGKSVFGVVSETRYEEERGRWRLVRTTRGYTGASSVMGKENLNIVRKKSFR